MPPISVNNFCSKSSSIFATDCALPRPRNRTQRAAHSPRWTRFVASQNFARRSVVRRASYVVALVIVTACGSKADIVIQGGSVWTGLSTGRGQPGAVAIAAGKILAVGDSTQIARYVGSKTDVLRANGGLILPGFADGHTHFVNRAFQLPSLDLPDARPPQAFARRPKEYPAQLKPGEWILDGNWGP